MAIGRPFFVTKAKADKEVEPARGSWNDIAKLMPAGHSATLTRKRGAQWAMNFLLERRR